MNTWKCCLIVYAPVVLRFTFVVFYGGVTQANLRIAIMTSSNGNIFRVTGSLCGEFTGHRWIPCTKSSDAELWCFLWFAHWINGWVNNREAGDWRRYRAHYDVIVMHQYHFTGIGQSCNCLSASGETIENMATWYIAAETKCVKIVGFLINLSQGIRSIIVQHWFR